MKVLYALFIAFGLLIFPYACKDNNSPTSSGGSMGPTPTPMPTAAVTVGTMSIGVFLYTVGDITITHGQSIQWDLTNMGHPLNIDMGSGSCLVSGRTSFPFTYTFTTPGTYHFHCGIHSSCGSGNCPNPFTCTGMIGTITVN
jgi:plastocyanin